MKPEASTNDQESELPVINSPYRFWKGLIDDLAAIYDQRELLRAFIARELRQRYKGSVLGWGWALAMPLVLLAVYGVAVGLFLGASRSIPEFAIYLYSGLLAWTFFSTIVNGSLSALPYYAGLIVKTSFQKELPILAMVVVALVDLGIQGSVLILGYLVYGSWPSLGTLAIIVPAILIITLLGVALGLFLSAANVRYRDIGYFTEAALQVGFWSVPIIYAYSFVVSALQERPLLMAIYDLNPMTAALSAVRYALWPSAESELGRSLLMPLEQVGITLAATFVASLVALWLGQRFFAKIASNVAQEL